MTRTVGIYAHHHGSGHMLRCREIKRELAGLGYQAVILSTRPDADVVLPDDALPDGAVGGADITAGGTLHFAPVGGRGLRERAAAVSRWVAESDPVAFYVDVSVEVALQVRLAGVPVVTLAMPGVRDDAAHQLGYSQAAAIVAAWPSWVPLPPHLEAHASRVHRVGGISRLRPLPGVDRDPRHVVVMAGEGGSTWQADTWRAVERACPEYRFTFLTGKNRVADPTEALAGAGVAVIAGGQNSVADVAAVGTPAVVLPQPRPFAEQAATARVLSDAALAVVPDSFPAPSRWPRLLESAAARRPDWARWETDGAARRAAEVIAGVAEARPRGRSAVLTLADASRAGHLNNQISLFPQGPDHVTAALSDPVELARAVPGTHVVDAPAGNLAAARNRAARAAVERDADTLFFLDADCVASTELTSLYAEALRRHPDAVVAGPVTYMKPGELRTTRPDPHPARPAPPPGETTLARDYDLFWSLSFAMTAATWRRIEALFGGFDEAFTGYGGEDTDFARNLKAHGIALYWVGGAHAFHQWHPVSSPPWEHLDDILANGAHFRSKWGHWPMEGWLRAFERAGAVECVDGEWRRTGQSSS